MNRRRRLIRGGAWGAGFVTPTTDWRLPITNAYVSSGDATWVAAMIASGTAKTLPTMTSNVFQPASTSRDYSFYVGEVGAAGGFISFTPTISGTGAITATAYESTDSVDGSAGSGSWSANSWTLWKPADEAAANGYGGREQRINIAAGPDRWVRLNLTTPAATTVLPYFGAFQLQADGSQDLWAMMGNSITTFPYTSLTARSVIQEFFPNSDPIVLFMARSGANSASIKTNQIDELTGNARFSGVLNVIIENSSGDVALSGVRPYATDPDPDYVGDSFETNINALKAEYGAAHVFASNIPFGDFTSGNGGIVPYTNGDISSADGNLPYNTNQVEPKMKALLSSSSWSATYDCPIKDDYIGIASDFSNYLSDCVHPSSPIGIRRWREGCIPFFRKAYGLSSVGYTALDQTVKYVGAKATSANKTNLQNIFDLLAATSDPVATVNRAALQSQITAITTTFSDITPTAPNILPNDAGIATGTLVAQFDASEFTKVTRALVGHTSAWVDRKNGYTMAQATATARPRLTPEQASGAKAFLDFNNANEAVKSMSSTDAGLIGLVNSAASAFTIFCVVEMPSAAGAGGEDIFGLGSATQNFILVGAQISAFAPRLLIGDTGGSAYSLIPTDASLVAGTRFAFAFRRDGAGNLKYYRGATTATGTTIRNGAVTGTVSRIGQRAQGGGSNNYTKYIHEIDVFSGAMSDAEIGNVLGGLREKWTDSSKTCI